MENALNGIPFLELHPLKNGPFKKYIYLKEKLVRPFLSKPNSTKTELV
jgi:hypothetical protein